MVFVRLFKPTRASRGSVGGTPMPNDSNLIDETNRIIEAMKQFRISSTDIFFLSQIPKEAQKIFKVTLSDVNVLFNPDEAGDQVSAAAFAVSLSEIFKGCGINCQTYTDFAEEFKIACKFENKNITDDQIVALFQTAIKQIRESATAIAVVGATSTVGKLV